MSAPEPENVRQVPLSLLRLDPNNPRLPEELQADSPSQKELALYINRHYDPLRIAESIAQHRFFESEPLIVVPEGDAFVVIEGNRRMTALLGLVDPELRAEFAEENSGWRSLDGSRVPQRIPVLVVQDPEEVAPLLGYRHISGIEPWDPLAQARYVASLVDKGKDLDDVAELVGRTGTEVRSMYRDFDILRQAKDQFQIDVSRAERAFGVFNNAMGRVAIRAFVGAPAPRDVDPDYYPLGDDQGEKLALLLRLIFGGARGDGRVITDSRQLGSLAKVLADPTGMALSALVATRSLDEALDAATDPTEQFERSVAKAVAALEKARALAGSAKSNSSQRTLARIEELVAELRERGQ